MAGQRLRAPVQCVEPRYSESARAKAEAAVVDHIYQRLATITGRQPLFVAHYKRLLGQALWVAKQSDILCKLAHSTKIIISLVW